MTKRWYPGLLLLTGLLLHGCGGQEFSANGSGGGFGYQSPDDNPNGDNPDGGCEGSDCVLPLPDPPIVVTPSPTPSATPPSNTPTPTPVGTVTAYTDDFTQGYTSKVDILWVIDSSGSMNEEQDSIRDNAARFTDKLVNAQVDFQLIVISTGASSNSELRNSCRNYDNNPLQAPEILKADTAEHFAQCADLVGINGLGDEEGIEASRRAVDPSFNGTCTAQSNTKCSLNTSMSCLTDADCAMNPGFVRPDANLEVVYVSDEEDQPNPTSWAGIATNSEIAELQAEMTSNLDSGTGRARDGREAYFPLLANHLAFFQGLKVGKQFRAHAVVLTYLNDPSIADDVCHNRTNSEESGQRYMSFADTTGGTTSDVCRTPSAPGVTPVDLGWAATMDDIGLQASGLNKCFTLSHSPTDIGSIVAKLDGVVTSVTYKQASKQVCFADYPPVGSVISVTYQ